MAVGLAAALSVKNANVILRNINSISCTTSSAVSCQQIGAVGSVELLNVNSISGTDKVINISNGGKFVLGESTVSGIDRPTYGLYADSTRQITILNSVISVDSDDVVCVVGGISVLEVLGNGALIQAADRSTAVNFSGGEFTVQGGYIEGDVDISNAVSFLENAVVDGDEFYFDGGVTYVSNSDIWGSSAYITDSVGFISNSENLTSGWAGSYSTLYMSKIDCSSGVSPSSGAVVYLTSSQVANVSVTGDLIAIGSFIYSGATDSIKASEGALIIGCQTPGGVSATSCVVAGMAGYSSAYSNTNGANALIAGGEHNSVGSSNAIAVLGGRYRSNSSLGAQALIVGGGKHEDVSSAYVSVATSKSLLFCGAGDSFIPKPSGPACIATLTWGGEGTANRDGDSFNGPLWSSYASTLGMMCSHGQGFCHTGIDVGLEASLVIRENAVGFEHEANTSIAAKTKLVTEGMDININYPEGRKTIGGARYTAPMSDFIGNAPW
jgi:hypothetical protein